MASNELASVRARRAAAHLERLLSEIEAGEHGLAPERAGVAAAHVRRTLDAYREAGGRERPDASARPRDRRANG
jgi:hypothetical protein